MNQVYIGNMVHFRTGTQNFKSKKMIYLKEDWVVVEDTHEALVNAETFWTVQERIKVKQPGKKRSENNIFRGIMFCRVRQAHGVLQPQKRRAPQVVGDIQLQRQSELWR